MSDLWNHYIYICFNQVIKLKEYAIKIIIFFLLLRNCAVLL